MPGVSNSLTWVKKGWKPRDALFGLFLVIDFRGMDVVMDAVIVLQDAHTGALEIIKLTAIHCFEEDPKCKENNGH